MLEVIGFNIDACLKAQSAGASRIELCANPGGGGTTPSYGFIKAAKTLLSIPVVVMIRPREGDFLYNDEEFEIMKTDIGMCRELGCDGVVTGILNDDGRIDKRRMSILKAMSGIPMSFHRAFDRVADPFTALEDLINIGCERVLTSGGRPTAEAALDRLKALVVQAAGRITVMPGGGIRSTNIRSIAQSTGAAEFHTSASLLKSGLMKFINARMKEELTYADVDEHEIASMVRELRKTLV
jgi:copper homeostasis protein